MPCKGCEKECKCTREKCDANCKCDKSNKCHCMDPSAEHTGGDETPKSCCTKKDTK